MAWGRVGELLIVVHGSRPPNDDEWASYLNSPETQDPGSVIVVTHGVRLTPTQRAQLQQRMESLDKVNGQKVRSAVLTDSLLSRGVVTALSWFGVEVRAFPAKHLEAALDYAGVAPARAQRVRDLLDELEASVNR